MSELFPWKSEDVCAALRLRYPTNEYAIAFEVPHEVGGGNRRADCVVMNLWRTSSWTLVAYFNTDASIEALSVEAMAKAGWVRAPKEDV